MPAKKTAAKKTARKAAKKPTKSFEETLWDTANRALNASTPPANGRTPNF